MPLLGDRPDRILWPRILVGGLFCTVMFGGPMYRQVFGGRSELVKDWVMYAGVALDFCRVEYFQAENGDVKPLPRLPLYGYAHFWDAPRETRLLRSFGAVRKDIGSICKKLGPSADLRANVDCATRKGWKARLRAEENLCTTLGVRDAE
jgi:hypothetical protein